MSRVTNKSNNSNKHTPFCRWCKDHGKSFSVYTSHFPRDIDGNTVCPDILSRKCSHCKEFGHTASSCQLLADEKRKRRSKEKQVNVDEDGFVSVSWRAKGVVNKKNKKVVAVATIIGFGPLKEDKPFERDWQTGFKTLAVAFGGRTKKERGGSFKGWAD